ncbi:MAG: hypothetical protein ACYC2K_02380 [Gemmatimonadales bacterium]
MRRATAGLLIAGTLSGCTGWRAQNVPVTDVMARNPEVIRVSTADSSGIVVFSPKIQNDTLTGFPTDLAIQRVNVPVRDITAVSTPYKHIGKTLLAGIAILGGIAVYGLLQTLNGVQ